MIEPRATARKGSVSQETGPSVPRPRRVEGGPNGVTVKNADPNKHYVGVYGPQVDEYGENGYIVEIVRKGGPSFGIGFTAKEGEPVLYRGHVLMSIDKAEWKRQQKEGQLDGLGGGQVWADEVEQRIIDARGQADPLRGIGGNFMTIAKNDPQYAGISENSTEFGI